MSIIYVIDLLMYPQRGEQAASLQLAIFNYQLRLQKEDIVFNYQQLNILDYEVHIRSAIDLFSLFLQNLFKT